MPGGRASAFWVEVTSTSTPSLSVSIREPAAELTASMHHTTSGYFLSTSAISSTGFWMPVDVSLCVMQMASYLPVERAASTISGVVGCPSSLLKISEGTPLPVAILYHLSPKAPTEKMAARLAVQERTAPSIRPVPEEVESRISCSVSRMRRRLLEMRRCRAEAALDRCPIIGPLMAASTSGATSVGPGMNNLVAICF